MAFLAYSSVDENSKFGTAVTLAPLLRIWLLASTYESIYDNECSCPWLVPISTINQGMRQQVLYTPASCLVLQVLLLVLSKRLSIICNCACTRQYAYHEIAHSHDVRLSCNDALAVRPRGSKRNWPSWYKASFRHTCVHKYLGNHISGPLHMKYMPMLSRFVSLS